MTTKQPSRFTVAQKQDALWRRACLAPWHLDKTQLGLYESIKNSKGRKFVINCSRRLGKTHMLCVIALEKALETPGADIKILTMSQKATRKIITPIMRQILQTCPRDLKPTFNVHDGMWRFPHNGSVIHCAGSEQQQSDSLRGQSCDLALVDEAGFCESLAYICDSILFPQLLTKAGSKMVLASTPPVSPDHDFVKKYMAQAMADQCYEHRTIYDNPRLTPEIIEEFKKEAGGENSTTWRREYLAEVVTESENAVFPELTDADLVRRLTYDVQRPQFFIPITAVDLGYADCTGALFGYYHFGLGKIVIEAELLLNRTNSAEIVRQILEIERSLWGPVVPRIRVVDAPALAIADLTETHRFQCRLPEKYDLQANVNRARVDFSNEALAISTNCPQLQSQIRFCTWDNTRTKFARTSAGHYDLVAALLYFLKHVDRRTNPTPAGYGWDVYNDFGFPRKRTNQAHESLKSMFPRIRPVK